MTVRIIILPSVPKGIAMRNMFYTVVDKRKWNLTDDASKPILHPGVHMFVFCSRLAAAQEAAAQAVQQQQAGAGAADRMGGASAAGPGQGPSSLFLFSEENPIRRYTRFIIEWPYPFHAMFSDRHNENYVLIFE